MLYQHGLFLLSILHLLLVCSMALGTLNQLRSSAFSDHISLDTYTFIFHSSMIFVTMVQHSIAFIIAWELMSFIIFPPGDVRIYKSQSYQSRHKLPCTDAYECYFSDCSISSGFMSKPEHLISKGWLFFLI